MTFTKFLPCLEINPSFVQKIITRFIHSEVTRIGFNRAVIGLSGGIDSSLVACLTAEALGPENVLGIRMPYRLSSPESLEHAQIVIDHLGIRHDTVDITPVVEPLFDRFPEITDRRKGNVMARQRMIILYDQSAAFDGLVIGTSNKTEALIGYSTLFGDSAAAIQPIGDLYKHQVRQLARAVGVPEAIINKPPSADLSPGQTDEGDIGFTYDALDQLLYMMVDQRYSKDELIEEGFEAEFVERVAMMVQTSHYKRVAPVILKLSNRTIGADFLYLRDWGT